MTIAEVEIRSPFNGMDAIHRAVAGGADPMPTEIRPGLFLCSHWNPTDYFGGEWDEWWYSDDETLPPTYGVCDSPEQFADKLLPRIQADDEFEYVVAFVRLKKSEQSPEGGWRWHKWGEYIGSQVPQREYLFDEPVIEEVYTYHAYRRPVGNR